jgi:hypothetical protein
VIGQRGDEVGSQFLRCDLGFHGKLDVCHEALFTGAVLLCHDRSLTHCTVLM